MSGQTGQWDVFPSGAIIETGNMQPGAPVLVKSLGDAAEYLTRWEPPVDGATWRKRRSEKDLAFRQAIGLQPLPPRTPLNARVLARHDLGGYTVENVIFESRPGFFVTANVYRSKIAPKGRHAAVLSPIGHFLTAGKAAADVQSRCIGLARMGFTVLAYDAIGHGERMAPGNIHHDAGYALLPLGETIAGWMVWDSTRAIDYLESLDDVDPLRIGVTGNSGGGLNTLFLSALDTRVRCATVAGYTFEFRNWLKYGSSHCTCTHLPGIFRSMEWFEIAGLVAPRALMMIQGASDAIFPISGARRAARNAALIYQALDQPAQVRFVELAGQPHAYNRAFREPMYGWMARHLLGQGDGGPIAEGELRPLPEDDPRLLCDPGKTLLHNPRTVVDLARDQALLLLAKPSPQTRETVQGWVLELTAPPEPLPHFLAPDSHGRVAVPGGQLEKVSFVSEDGQSIPGLLWLPERPLQPARTVVIADSLGKARVAGSGLVGALLDAGVTVFAIDLRGRGETLGYFRPGVWDTNYRLVSSQVDFGRPLAGRRAFDLLRALDFLAARTDLPGGEIAVLGLGDDSLPALLASAADGRIRHTALARSVSRFVSLMRARVPRTDTSPRNSWNDPQLTGRVNAGGYSIDFGSAIPSVLHMADVPDLAGLIAPRRVLFCQALDGRSARLLRMAQSAGSQWFRYEPERPLDAALLLEWLKQGKFL
ncbi:MAG: acetylxylan esterase [Acidobacteria bacterium]|nr:acetylxylan esterase [Acidobacteriota bacterium]